MPAIERAALATWTYVAEPPSPFDVAENALRMLDSVHHGARSLAARLSD